MARPHVYATVGVTMRRTSLNWVCLLVAAITAPVAISACSSEGSTGSTPESSPPEATPSSLTLSGGTLTRPTTVSDAFKVHEVNAEFQKASTEKPGLVFESKVLK